MLYHIELFEYTLIRILFTIYLTFGIQRRFFFYQFFFFDKIFVLISFFVRKIKSISFDVISFFLLSKKYQFWHISFTTFQNFISLYFISFYYFLNLLKSIVLYPLRKNSFLVLKFLCNWVKLLFFLWTWLNLWFSAARSMPRFMPSSAKRLARSVRFKLNRTLSNA